MSIRLVELACYGRHYSYDESNHPIWWFDRESGTPIFIDDLLRQTGIDDASQIDDEALEYVGIIPFFQFDTVSLEREYVGQYFDRNEKKILLSFSGEEFDRSFREAIDSRNLGSDWCAYEMSALKKAAIDWAKNNRVRYDEE